MRARGHNLETAQGTSAAASALRQAGTDSRTWLRVAPPPPITAPRLPFVLLVLLLVTAGILGLLMLNAKINEDALRLSALREQQSTLDAQEQRLISELAELEDPGNLAAAARRLGLVPAEAPAFLELPDGRVIGVPRPAGAAE